MCQRFSMLSGNDDEKKEKKEKKKIPNAPWNLHSLPPT